MLKVLLAEDDATMVSLLKTLLKMEGFEVVSLDSDADVVDAVRRERPDVLLMDVHLSDQNGLDVLKSLREAEGEEGNRVRVVMTSGLNVEQECRDRGADEFLLKPFMPDDLIAILKNNK
ncbi:MAG: response regulator [Chloroflexota bacterium]